MITEAETAKQEAETAPPLNRSWWETTDGSLVMVRWKNGEPIQLRVYEEYQPGQTIEWDEYRSHVALRDQFKQPDNVLQNLDVEPEPGASTLSSWVRYYPDATEAQREQVSSVFRRYAAEDHNSLAVFRAHMHGQEPAWLKELLGETPVAESEPGEQRPDAHLEPDP